jgi:hypothetical protein
MEMPTDGTAFPHKSTSSSCANEEQATSSRNAINNSKSISINVLSIKQAGASISCNGQLKGNYFWALA